MAPMPDRLPIGLSLFHGYGIDHKLVLDDKEDTDLGCLHNCPPSL